MKKLYIILILFGFNYFSYSQNVTQSSEYIIETLCNTWKPDYLLIENKKIYKGSTQFDSKLIFNKDFTFYKVGFENKVSTKWSINQENKCIDVYVNEKLTFKIVKLNKSSLTMIILSENNTNNTVLVLKKI